MNMNIEQVQILLVSAMIVLSLVSLLLAFLYRRDQSHHSH